MEIETLRNRCEKVIESISQIPRRTNITEACKSTLLKLAHSDLHFLSRLLPSTPSLSSNIGHLESVVHLLAHHPSISGVSRVCKPIPLTRRRSVHVDIVCLFNNLPVWVIVSDRNPKYLTWDGNNEKGQTLKQRLSGVLDLCNSEDALVSRPCSIVVFFARGVGDWVIERIREEFGGFELERFDLSGVYKEGYVEGGEWVDVVPVSSRLYSEARLVEIKVGNCEKEASLLGSIRVGSWWGEWVGDGAFGSLVKGMKGGAARLDGGGQFVNFDTTALVAVVSGISNGCAEKLLAAPEIEMRRRFKGNYGFVIAQVKSEIENPILAELTSVLSGKTGIVCETVVSEFKELVSMCGGPNEKSRADMILKCLIIVLDGPSERMMGLPTTRKLALKNKVVFGTGDHWRATTLTANMAFVRAVSQTGMSLCSIEHRPRALTGLLITYKSSIGLEPYLGRSVDTMVDARKL